MPLDILDTPPPSIPGSSAIKSHSTVFRNFLILSGLVSLGCVLLYAADWPTQGGSPQREGWAKSERTLKQDNIRDLKILYTFRPESPASPSLSAPIIDGNLITYRGFKEMLVFSANSSRVFSVDADLNKVIWESNVEAGANRVTESIPGGPCSSGWSSPVVMDGSSSATMHFAGRTGGRPRRSPYFPPLSESLYPLRPTTLSSLNAMYTVSADGNLHILNSSTGEDLLPPVPFVPPGAKVSSLNVRENVVYVTTADGCDGKQNALYAIDLLSSDKHVASYVAPRGGFSGTAGASIAPNGTVFVQVASAPDDKPGHTHQTLVALTPKDLKVKAYFTPRAKQLGAKGLASPGITPLVFTWHGKATVLAGFADGRLYLLNGDTLGGPDHRTSLLQTKPIIKRGKNYDGSGFRGTFSSWADVDGDKRWFYAPAIGPDGGAILAFRLANNNGRPELEQVWTSRSMISPAPTVVANGMIFALSSGNSPRLAKKNGRPYTREEKAAMAKPAVLYALDAVTGRELYSSGDTIRTTTLPSGLAVANARVYFPGMDGRMYCLGLPRTQPQLAEQQ
jgi:outer membrane protein assembly factor BamB